MPFSIDYYGWSDHRQKMLATGASENHPDPPMRMKARRAGEGVGGASCIPSARWEGVSADVGHLAG